MLNSIKEKIEGDMVLFADAADDASGLGGGEDELSFRWHRTRTWRVGPVWVTPRILTEVWAGRWDVVVLSWNARQLELSVALLMARIRGVRVVLWGQGFGKSGSHLSRRMRRWQAHAADMVLTYGERGADEVSTEAPGARVEVVLNTTGRPSPTADQRLAAVNRHVAFVGRLIPHKRIDLLISAIAILHDRGDSLGLVVIGDGPGLEEARSAADAAGIADSVTWHGKVTDWGELRGLLAGCDLVVMPNHAGLAVVDAFAAGRGVVVPDDHRVSPPEADLVLEGQTGLRFAPQTAQALADRLASVYSEPQDLAMISERCISLYRERLSLDRASQRFADLLTQVGRSCRRSER